ncbi:MAG: dimethylsulfoxide reductase subunit B [Bacteroidetes bacterium]|nr:MAG: dimethylsulfoxide reductase subunit B [Bacteroidota bacterium]
MKQWAFYFDSSQCSGCKTCQIACKDKHNLPVGLRWRNVYEIAGGTWQQKDHNWKSGIHSYNISLSCNHCEDPICMKKCPNKAITKNGEGLVLIDEKRCMGCEYCKWACPYGALHLDKRTGKMTKCTFCADYIEQGKLPSCVSSCPMRVLEAGPLEKLRQKEGINNEVYPLPPNRYTRPALAIKPHPSASQLSKWQIINKEEVKDV